jgi:hypothetical protein
MNPYFTHIPALLTALGLVVNAVWTVVNFRSEARIGRKIDELKGYIDRHYVCKLDCPHNNPAIPRACQQD